MDATRFGFLLLHAGALPRLAMQQMLEEIATSLQDEAPLDPGAQATFETEARVQLEQATDHLEAHPELLPPMELDLFRVGADLSDEERRRLRAEADAALDRELAEEQAMFAGLPGDDGADEGPLDLAAFLARAYAQPAPQSQVAAALGRVDVAGLESLLGRLPATLPPLWAPLDAEGLAAWLALFREEDATLEAVVDVVTGSAQPD